MKLLYQIISLSACPPCVAPQSCQGATNCKSGARQASQGCGTERQDFRSILSANSVSVDTTLVNAGQL